MRWAITLSRFNFTIKHQPGKQAVCSDALSRRDQDLPQNSQDERLVGRFQQLLIGKNGGSARVNIEEVVGVDPEPDPNDPFEYSDHGVSDQAQQATDIVVKAGFVTGGDHDDDSAPDEQHPRTDPPENPFQDEALQKLWDQGLDQNNRYWLIRQAVIDGDR